MEQPGLAQGVPVYPLLGPAHTQLWLSVARACDSSQRAFSLIGIAYFL